MYGPRRSSHHMGFEDALSDEDGGGECWRLDSLTQPSTPHFCRSCMLGFRDRILLNNHLKMHYLEKKESERAEEKMKKWKDGTFRCMNCKMSFHSPEQLKIHSESCAVEEGAMQCEMCDAILRDKASLAAHYTSVHKLIECAHCREQFVSYDDLNIHMQLDHDIESPPPKKWRPQRRDYVSLACECGKVFESELDYQEHVVEDHPGSEPVKWPEVRRKRRNDHRGGGGGGEGGGYYAVSKKSKRAPPIPIRQRVNDEQFLENGEGGMCVECGEMFAKTVELKRHMQNEHIHLKPYACSICGRRFTRKSDVKRHIETIHGQAVSKEDMERIQAIRPFRCAKCGNPFGRYSDIKKHIELHHGLPFSPDTYVYQREMMDEGGLSIGSSGEVVNVRTFDCGLCKRKYRNKTTVRHHIRKDHNQEEPDAFITRSNAHHSEGVECQFCGDIFHCLEDKLEHVQNIHHGVVDEEQLGASGPLSGVVQQIPSHYTPGYLGTIPISAATNAQDLIQRGEEGEGGFMPVKDVSTPEKQGTRKNQIVILKQEVLKGSPHKVAAQGATGGEGEWVGDGGGGGGGGGMNSLSDVKHPDEKPGYYDCPDCSRSFTYRRALKSHIHKMHRQEEFECECGKTFKHQREFVRHLQTAHPELKEQEDVSQVYYECGICDEGYEREEDLAAHIAHLHPEELAKEGEEEEEGLDEEGGRAPLATNPAPLQPTLAEPSSSPPSQMHSGESFKAQAVSVPDAPHMEYYTCVQCGSMFSSTESLTRHMNTRHKKRPAPPATAPPPSTTATGEPAKEQGDKDS